jgi:hypothetical protein
MKNATIYKIAAMVIMGIMIVYWLVRSLSAIFSGNTAAAGTLYQMVLAGILAFLSWKWPLPGGILIALLSVVIAMYYMLVLYSLYQALPALLLISTPMAISGLLLIEADWSVRRLQRQR